MGHAFGEGAGVADPLRKTQRRVQSQQQKVTEPW